MSFNFNFVDFILYLILRMTESDYDYIMFNIHDFLTNFVLRKTTFNFVLDENNFNNLINSFYYFINYSSFVYNDDFM